MCICVCSERESESVSAKYKCKNVTHVHIYIPSCVITFPQYRTSGVRFAHSKAKDPYLLLGDLKLALRVRKKLVMFDAGYKQADDGSIPWVGVVRPYREKWVALLTAGRHVCVCVCVCVYVRV
jgi:hypothetical protein